MTDAELIARLRLYGRSEVAVLEAADRIEALLNLNEALVELMDDRDAKLAQAVELLEEIEVRLKPISGFFFDTFPRREIKATLAEIKGESHE